jgi:hypothetical protein
MDIACCIDAVREIGLEPVEIGTAIRSSLLHTLLEVAQITTRNAEEYSTPLHHDMITTLCKP